MGSFWNLFTSNEPEHPAPKLVPLCAVEYDPDYVCWGLSDVPVKEATDHFVSFGVIKSGKTTGFRLFLQSIAPRFQPQHPHAEQLIMFDAKGDALPMLDGMGISPKGKETFSFNSKKISNFVKCSR